MLLYPGARVFALTIIIFFVTVIEIPALVMLAVWFVGQALFAAADLINPTGSDELACVRRAAGRLRLRPVDHQAARDEAQGRAAAAPGVLTPCASSCSPLRWSLIITDGHADRARTSRTTASTGLGVVGVFVVVVVGVGIIGALTEPPRKKWTLPQRAPGREAAPTARRTPNRTAAPQTRHLADPARAGGDCAGGRAAAVADGVERVGALDRETGCAPARQARSSGRRRAGVRRAAELRDPPRPGLGTGQNVRLKMPLRSGILFERQDRRGAVGAATGACARDREPHEDDDRAGGARALPPLRQGSDHPRRHSLQRLGVGLLPQGKRVPVLPLLYGLLLPSGNDAAIALAQHVAGAQTRFIALMNARARQLGCTARASTACPGSSTRATTRAPPSWR